MAFEYLRYLRVDVCVIPIHRSSKFYVSVRKLRNTVLDENIKPALNTK